MIAVYSIRNTINDHIYIGSSICFDVRMRMHKHQLNKNKHHSIVLQRAWNKYGKNSFEVGIIEYVEQKDKVIEREQAWINFFKPEYNIASIAGAPMTGKKHSESTKRMFSQIRTGKKKYPLSDLQKKNISDSKYKTMSAVEQMDANGKVLNEYRSVADAGRAMGVRPEAIGNAIRKHSMSSKFWWKHKEVKPNKHS